MIDAHDRLADEMQAVPEEQVVRLVDAPGLRVVQRHEPGGDAPDLDGLEHLANRRQRLSFRVGEEQRARLPPNTRPPRPGRRRRPSPELTRVLALRSGLANRPGAVPCEGPEHQPSPPVSFAALSTASTFNQDALFQDALEKESLFQEALFQEAEFQEAVFQEASTQEAEFQDALSCATLSQLAESKTW